MNNNPLFWIPLTFIRGYRNNINSGIIKNSSQVQFTTEAVKNTLARRIVIASGPLLLSVPGFIYMVYHTEYSQLLLLTLSPLMSLCLLSILVLISTVLTNKFIRKIVKDADNDAITYRFLLQKKRSFIYSVIISSVTAICLYNNHHILYMLLCQIVTALIVYLPLYQVHKAMILIRRKKNILSFINIMNPQYFNRFRSNKNDK
jgi:hypothetical protein